MLAQSEPDSGRQKTEDSEDYSETPFTQYGEFNEEEDEAEAALFFQFGRFFGVSLGAGFSGATGNRGLLWKGGFPVVDVKVHYWFGFNLAMQLEFFTASHFYDAGGSAVDVTMNRLAADIKYYFDTRNLSAALTFANPYILAGAGVFTKSESASAAEESESDNKFGFSLGAGLEFIVSHRKTYFTLEGKVHFVSFDDRFTTQFQGAQIQDLTGAFYTFVASVLFTW